MKKQQALKLVQNCGRTRNYHFGASIAGSKPIDCYCKNDRFSKGAVVQTLYGMKVRETLHDMLDGEPEIVREAVAALMEGEQTLSAKDAFYLVECRGHKGGNYFAASVAGSKEFMCYCGAGMFSKQSAVDELRTMQNAGTLGCRFLNGESETVHEVVAALLK